MAPILSPGSCGAVALLILALAGCATDRTDGLSPEAEQAILSRTVHELTWRDYDGTGDPESAAFLLDGRPVGKGSEGLAQLRRIITKMPRGSRIDIGHYYVDEGGGRRPRWPFDMIMMRQYAEPYGVSLGVPNAR